MFRVKASFSDSIEVGCGPDEAFLYFSNLRNFVELMPGIESIHTDLKGVTNWTIRAEIPIVGVIRERFPVRNELEGHGVIEWIPSKGETLNLLRFSAQFEKISEQRTLIHFSQGVELRREKARDLHPLAGMVGEGTISREMDRRVSEMIREFIVKTRNILEGKTK